MDATSVAPLSSIAWRLLRCACLLAAPAPILWHSEVLATEPELPPVLAAPNTGVSVEDAVIADAQRGADAAASSSQIILPPRSEAATNGPSALRPGRSEPRTQPTTDGSHPWYRSTLLSLLMVLAIIAGAAWLVRRMVPSLRAGESAGLHVFARTAISQRQTLVLVQVGRRVLVLGISPNRVDRLAEIDEPCEVAELAAGAGGKLGPRFENMLEERVGDFTTGEVDEEGDVPLASQPAPIPALLRRLKALQRSA